MGLSNAERQRRWRDKRNAAAAGSEPLLAEIDKLQARIRELKAATAITEVSGLGGSAHVIGIGPITEKGVCRGGLGRSTGRRR